MTRCYAVLNIPHERDDEVPQCLNEGFFQVTTWQRGKDGKLQRFNQDCFCEEHAYEFSMYYSNYLGLRVKIKFAKIKSEKVSFS